MEVEAVFEVTKNTNMPTKMKTSFREQMYFQNSKWKRHGFLNGYGGKKILRYIKKENKAYPHRSLPAPPTPPKKKKKKKKNLYPWVI